MNDTVTCHEPDALLVVEEEVVHADVVLDPHTLLVEEEPVYVLPSDEDAVAMVVVESQGPAGPPGDPGSPAESVASKVVSIYVGGNRAVAVRPDGRVEHASNTNPEHTDTVYGITTGAAYDGEYVPVRRLGEMREPSWNWLPGKPVFVAVDGMLTQTPPADGFLSEIGVALTSTVLDIHIERSIRR